MNYNAGQVARRSRGGRNGLVERILTSACEPLERLLGKIDPELARIIERALQGSQIDSGGAFRLAACRGEEVVALALAADRVRQERVGEVVTYVVNRNINFTNVCFVGCRFCAFSRTPHHAEAYFLSPQEVARRAEEAWEMGAREVCVQGGLPRGLDGFYYRELLRAIKQAVPEMHVHAFSPMEILYGVQLTGMELGDYLSMLKDAGLDTLPGTAAEILDDDVRSLIERQKLTAAQWVEIVTTAHRRGIPTTSTMMYGHTETVEHWVRHILLIREIQRRTGGFTEFVPLGFVHQNTQLFKSGAARPGPTDEEHIKAHALARLLLQGWVDNVQVSWVKMPRATAQACLRSGANDYGGTLMEENISRLAGSTAGQYASPDALRSRILELGRVPAERTTTYQIVKRFDPPLSQ